MSYNFSGTYKSLRISGSDDLAQLLTNISAIKEGHFILSSGLHCAVYVQAAALGQHPQKTEFVCTKLASLIKRLNNEKYDTVASIALGGIIFGQELARIQNKRAIFLEKTADKRLELRRSLEVSKNEKILILEDVITTGASALQAVEYFESKGAIVVGIAAIINRRSESCNSLSTLPYISLLNVSAETYTTSDLPEWLRKIPPVRPGSSF